jgi:hypothetical protein
MAMVGSSMVIGGSGLGFSTSQKLSPMVMPGMPAIATISPTCVSSMSVRLRLLPGAHGAVEDAADREATEVVGVVEVGDEDLHCTFGLALGNGDGGDDLLKERLQVGSWDRGIGCGSAELAVRVEDREVEHALVGIEIDEEVIDLVEDLLRARVGAVDLVDHDHRGETGFERLREHVAGLWKWAFGCIDEEDNAVDHLQSALDFATEVGVAGRVDDVDLVVVIIERGVFGEDGDSALSLEIARVHDALGDGLVGAKGAALAKHGVDEGGLAMIDVGDDGDIKDGLDGDCG